MLPCKFSVPWTEVYKAHFLCSIFRTRHRGTLVMLPCSISEPWTESYMKNGLTITTICFQKKEHFSSQGSRIHTTKTGHTISGFRWCNTPKIFLFSFLFFIYCNYCWSAYSMYIHGHTVPWDLNYIANKSTEVFILSMSLPSTISLFICEYVFNWNPHLTSASLWVTQCCIFSISQFWLSVCYICLLVLLVVFPFSSFRAIGQIQFWNHQWRK